MPGDNIRLLSLDGGGVRGLSSLMILQKLMAPDDPESPPKKPCEYFDMIGGTSTGGLIAIMLGRLRMTVEECIEAYTSLSDQVFEKKSRRFSLKVKAKFNTADLEAVAKKIIRDRGFDQETLLQDSSDTVCKVFVCAASKQTKDTVCLRSYQSPRGSDHLLKSTTIWQACRATSAATTFFDPITIGPFNEEFIDGALGSNNPVYKVWQQALDIWGDEELQSKLACLISIGTGVPPVKAMRYSIPGVLTALKELATDTEKTSEDFARDKSHLGRQGHYFRFNVAHGLEDIGLEESKKKDMIAAATSRYLAMEATHNQVQACIAQLGVQNSFDPVVAPEPPPYTFTSDDHRCLKHLKTTEPQEDKNRINQTKGGLLKGAYDWILENDDFQQWRRDSSRRLLWIKGDPGKGKTMLLSGIIKELTRLAPDTVSFFFCQAVDERINSAIAVLRGLVYLLINNQPSLISHLRKRYDQAGKELFEGVNAWQSIKGIFTSILDDPTLKSTFLVIDALDECTFDRDLLVELVIEISSVQPRVKWVVSSRNLPSIEEFLNNATQKVSINLELNEKSVSKAVSWYIHHEVEELAKRKGYADAVRQDIVQYLLSNARGTFLWAALVIVELVKAKRWEAPQLLEKFPPGLEPLYSLMLKQIGESGHAELCRRILAIATCVYRPIRLHELKGLISLPDVIAEDDKNVADVIRSCGSFLTFQGRRGFISFVHQSAKDFLLEAASAEIFLRGIKHEHQNIFSHSLDVLEHSLTKRNLWCLPFDGSLVSEAQKPDPDPLEAAQYSCLYWIDHLQDSDVAQSGGNDVQVNGVLDRFLKERYLYWLEALSLLGEISIGIKGMIKLEGLIKMNGGCDELLRRFQDASRFFRYHRSVIQRTPLQLYSSLLLFSPVSSLTRTCHLGKIPGWVLHAPPPMENDWGLCLHNLYHDGTVSSVFWSPDGSKLGSASYDETVKIWDPVTGHCIHTMRGHTEIIMSAAWSPNGSCIASVSHDRTMRIWDPVTGKCVLTNSDHATRLKKLAWSSVGQLASVTEDYTINILNSDTKCSITHEERTKLISCIAWSQNGSRFASGSYSSTIYVWDPFTGDCITTLKDPGTYVHSVAFSEDGKRLFSGSDNIFKLWNIATRDFTPLEGHTKQVNIAAWSKDYRRIASGSSDWTVKIWNPSTLQCLSTLHGHMGEVHTIIWSPDGTRLASAGGYGHWGDGTVRIWNTVTAELISILMVPTSIPTIDSMAWSPDGSRLALGGYDNIVRVWDLSFDSAPSTPGPSTSALEMHNNEANHVSWSLETSYLVSVSKDGEIKIWSRITKHCIWTIKMVGTKFLSVAWSPQDPNRFASGSDDGTVKIWDLLARKCMCILEGGLGWVKHISWSPDGNQIAGGGRFSMAVWVVSTGRHIRIDHYDGKIYWSIWSTDGSQLASMDEWRIITLWDVNTGKRIADFDEGSPSCDGLEGARSSGSTFRVESGVIVPDYTSQSRRGKGYGSRRDWITYEGADLLWIPPEFQAQEWSISDNMVAIGCASGRVLMFEFAQDRSGSS